MNEILEKNFIIDGIFFDLENRQIVRNDQLLTLNSKYFDVLIYLIKNAERLITKDELFLNVWGDTYVSDTALSQCIKDIRKTLNDDAKNPSFLKTVPKHGFIFLKRPKAISDSNKIKSGISSSDIYKKRPYKFLDYFTEEDKDIFFGREQEINELCSKILNHRSFLIYGRSGVGKSSLVHAGLIPELKKKGQTAIVIRSFSDPIAEIKELLFEDESERSRELSKLISKKYRQKNKNVICFLDQFEEFFLLAKPSIRRKFISAIQKIYKKNSEIFKLVFVIREDLFAEMSAFKDILPEVFFHEHRLPRLTLDQTQKAIFEPAKLMNINFEDTLVEKIISDLEDGEYIDPPQLQIVCDTLFDKKNSKSTISLDSYKNLGGARQILAGYLDRVLQHFKKNELYLVKEILLSLINEKNERQVLTLEDLKNQLDFNLLNENIFEELIEELSNFRVVRLFSHEGETWIELTHDFLAPEVTKWQSSELVAIKQVKKLISRAIENYTTHQLFLDSDTISLILPLGEKIRFTNEESDFLVKSMLNRSRIIPRWLIEKSPSSIGLINEALKDKNSAIRKSAIESAKNIRDEDLKKGLSDLALTDYKLSVRKAASIALAETYGSQALDILHKRKKALDLGLVRYTICCAFIRDYNKSLAGLENVNFFVVLLMFSGLMWIRFRRQKENIFKQSLSASIGTAFSGLFVGLFLGFLLIFYRNQNIFESTTILLSLTSLGALSGFFVGWGIAFGMIGFKYVGYRHSRWWLVVGAILGGWIIGGIINLIGVDIFIALSGQKLTGLAGAFEAAVVGFGLSIGYSISEQYPIQIKWRRILFPAIGSMIAATILTFIEGSMFSASIEKIAESFSDSKIDFIPLANIFGEKYFGIISRLSLGAFEGFIFGVCFCAGLVKYKMGLLKSKVVK